MLVYIAWSGDRSKQVALVLRDWLGDVFHQIECWVSESDIDAGRSWSGEIASKLDEADVGIICVTSENQEKPWLNFEAGAIAKRMDESRAIPYLLDLSKTDLRQPLASLQAVYADKAGTMKMLESINNALGDGGLVDERLQRSHKKWWPDLKGLIDNIKSDPSGARTPERTMSEKVDEILSHVRGIRVSAERELKYDLSSLPLGIRRLILQSQHTNAFTREGIEKRIAQVDELLEVARLLECDWEDAIREARGRFKKALAARDPNDEVPDGES